MEIEIHAVPESTLEAFAEKHGLTMVVKERNQKDLESYGWTRILPRYYCGFKDCELKGDGVLHGVTGNGGTIDEAMADYMNEISGGVLVMRPYGPERVEIKVPRLISIK